MRTCILKLEHSNTIQQSLEGCRIQKISSSISPLSFAKLLQFADNKVNPRIATVNKITKSIHETLEKSPELFWYKSKGILVSTEDCQVLDRGRVRMTFDNEDFEGIMDGGHNTFAIAIFMVEKLFGVKLKSWDECKDYWNDNYEDIISKIEKLDPPFQFSIPIEILAPNSSDGAIEEFYDFISEICSARNNNVQLKETAKGNQVGYYDYLKDVFDKDPINHFDVIWKTGESGKIKSEDVISLACIGLIFLSEQGQLPREIGTLSKVSVYSHKGKCVDFFNNLMENKAISFEENGKYILQSEAVKSVLEMTPWIMRLFDDLYIQFPDLYHEAAPGKFGRISSVNMKPSRAPFGTTEDECSYQYSSGYIYPLICGLTSLMGFDEETGRAFWLIEPEKLNLNELALTQYVELIKMANFDPQKVGKGAPFYNESVNVFERLEQQY